MKPMRFQIRCTDGQWRYVFCRSVYSSDAATGLQVISTESREHAFVSYSQEQAAKDLAYFTEHANGAEVREEIPMP